MGVFESLGGEITSLLGEVGIKEPTEIQEAAIPLILSGSSVLVISPTGTGKTEAALLPILSKILSLQERRPLTALYITPMRALNRDIWRRMVDFAGRLGIRIEVRHSDTSAQKKRAQTKNPPDILITTPETLGIILNIGSLRSFLKNVRYLVVDEYHELLESKRGVQLSLNMERLKNLIGDRGSLQIIGLSATIGDPTIAIKALLGIDGEGMVVEAGVERSFKVSIIHISRGEEEGEEVSLAEETLIQRVKEAGKTLIFTNTRSQAETLSLRLKMKAPELRIGVHHSSLSAQLRRGIEEAFNRDKLDVVVCTSSMELGVDIEGVKTVIQWTSPRRIVKLAQRIGRSEHRPGQPARGIIFTRNMDDFFESLAIIELLREGRIEKPILYKDSLDILAQQVVGVTLNHRGVSLDQIYALVKGSYFYSNLSKEGLLELAKFLEQLHLLHLKDGRCYGRRESIPYYFENVSTIPEVVSYNMRDAQGRTSIASLDESFVGEYCDKSSKILVNGETWRVVRVDEDERKVYVTKDSFDVAVIPQWIGELLLVDHLVAERAGGLQKNWLSGDGMEEGGLGGKGILGEGLEEVKETVKGLAEAYGALPGVRNLAISLQRGEKANLVILHTFQGDRVNEALAQLVRAVMKPLYGVEVDYAITPYRVIFLDGSKSLEPSSMVNILRRVVEFRGRVRDILEAEVSRQGKFLWVFWNVCKRMGVVRRDSTYRRRLALDLYRRLRNSPPAEEAANEVFTHYYDIEGVDRLLEGVGKGEIEIMAREHPSWSRLEMEYFLGRETPAYKDFMEEREAIGLLKKRVKSSRVNLACINCGATAGPYTLSFLTLERLRCPTCKGRLLAPYFPSEENLRLIKKIKRRAELEGDEEQLMERLRTAAKLVSRFGVRALWCLQAYGVGVETAKRILSHSFMDEDDLFKRILDAQKIYFETRMYWKD